MKKTTILLAAIFLLASLTFIKNPPPPLTADTPVADVLAQLGEAPPKHFPNPLVQGVSAERGRDLVQKGFASKPSGGKGARVSKHFVCTSCHNVERDEPDLAASNPEARLRFAAEKGLPYLQGSALYGVVNRTSFYNGDYEKKYSDLVKLARNDLRESIQLCATECSQGRRMEDWELESTLAYLWTIGLKMSDLRLSEGEFKKISAAAQGSGDKRSAADLVKSRYLRAMPATFLDPPKDRKSAPAGKVNPENGRLIYEKSCLHCHAAKRYSFFPLDDSKLSFHFLDFWFPTHSRYSVYQVARYGTSPVPLKRAYMPNFTQEKMSGQMLEDLRAYVGQKSSE